MIVLATRAHQELCRLAMFAAVGRVSDYRHFSGAEVDGAKDSLELTSAPTR
jgi:hypothetical protein